MRNFILIAVYLLGTHAFGMNSMHARKDMIVTEKIGNENVCLEVASLSQSTLSQSSFFKSDSQFSLKCLPYKNYQNTYALVANVTNNAKPLELSFSYLKGPTYELIFKRRESRPRAITIEEHRIGNDEVIVTTKTASDNYSVLVPFKRTYDMTSQLDGYAELKQDIKNFGVESNILDVVFASSNTLKADAILIRVK